MSCGISLNINNDYDRWLPLCNIRVTNKGRVEAHVLLDPDVPWFRGHFERMPLLPGVALLALAGEAVRRSAELRRSPIKIAGFTKVRFKQLVFPGEILSISVAAPFPLPRADLDFVLDVNRGMAAKGFMQVCSTKL